MITQTQIDAIYNALLVGMALEDAYIFAGLSPKTIEEVSEDENLQRQWAIQKASYEKGLLDRLSSVIDKQSRAGKESAITWMLERTNPRYSTKSADRGGEVHIHLSDKDPASYDTFEIHQGSSKSED